MTVEQKTNHAVARSLSNAGLGVTGVGCWCAPGPATEQTRKWLVLFEDKDKGQHVFEDETEAYLFFGKAEAMGWNCHLFAHAPRVTPNAYSCARAIRNNTGEP